MNIKAGFNKERILSENFPWFISVISTLLLSFSIISTTSCNRKSQAQQDEADLKLVGYELTQEGLSKAAKNDDIQALKIFKARRFDFNKIDLAGRSAVHSAVEFGSISALEFLAKNDADIELADHAGITPLMVAAKSEAMQNEEAIEYLLEKGASATRKDKVGKFALIHAIDGGSPEAINLLAAESRKLLDTGLLYAADMDEHEAIPSLVKYGASVYARNKGKTALMLAAERGNEKVVKTLLDEGANLYAVSDEGKLAKDYAKDSASVLAVLLESENLENYDPAEDLTSSELALNWSEEEMEALVQKAMARSPISEITDKENDQKVVLERIKGKSLALELSDNVKVAEKVTMAAYAEKSLPIKIQADESGNVEIRDLRGKQPGLNKRATITEGSQIGMTGLSVKQIRKKVVNNKLTGGEDKELVTLMIEDEKTGQLRELYAGYESQAAEAIAVLKINETGEYLIIEREDEFYDLKGTAYKVMDVNDEEVIIENIGNGQLSILPLMGIKR